MRDLGKIVHAQPAGKIAPSMREHGLNTVRFRFQFEKGGELHMLMGEARQGQGAPKAKDPRQVKEWFYIGPHVMLVLPDSAKDALRGINQDMSNNQPYTSLLSSADVATPVWVIPVAKGGDRIRDEPAK
jgi:hypothetical protein